MRKIVYGMAVSLDGFMEGPNGETDWMTYNPDNNADEYLEPFDTFLIGRKTYEKMLSLGGSYAFPGIKNVVLSNSLSKVAAGFDLVCGQTVNEVRMMKDQPGKDIALYGGAELASSLIQGNLVDEVVLSIHPVVLGAGKPMFQSLKERINLMLFKTKMSQAGVTLHYRINN